MTRTLLTALAILWFLAGALAGRTLATTPRNAPSTAVHSEAPYVPGGTHSVLGEVRESAVGWHPYPDPVPGGASPLPTVLLDSGPVATAPATRPPAVSGHSISGISSWYAYVEGQAAAGPALRAFLGPHWRGMTVRVCAASCEWIRLTDWMQADRLIDLDSRSWAVICGLPLSLGLCRVVVRG